jgi:uncharacterized membrane protein
MDESEKTAAAPPLDQDHYHTALAHLYRGELHRMTIWRSRLDTTSNWAILLTTGLTTFTLGTEAVPHYTLLLGLALNSICMLIEGRRYLHLHHSEFRLHLLEAGYFGHLLAPASLGFPGWQAALGTDLREPRPTMTIFESVRMRLRRNYALLFYFTTAVWLTKLFIHQVERADETFYERLAVGHVIPSWLVAISAGVFLVLVTVLAVGAPRNEPLEGGRAASAWRRASERAS